MKQPLTMSLLAALLVLAACSEKPQVAGSRKADGKPWESSQSAFLAKGWKGGDQASWDQQLKTRMQNQNEYSRAPAKP